MCDSNLIATTYLENREMLTRYFRSHINDVDQAEDLVQDVFLRLLESGKSLKATTVISFVFSIARNVLNDYLRRLYVRKDYSRTVMETADYLDFTTESEVVARDLRRMELRIVGALSPQRRMAYIFRRFHEMSTKEIAFRMNVNDRTADSHIYRATREVRMAMRRCS